MKSKKVKTIVLSSLLVLILFAIGIIRFAKESELDEDYYEEEFEKEGYDKPEGYYKFFHQITTPIGKSVSDYKPNYALSELKKAKQKISARKSTLSSYNWTQRGPGNVGGRTREVIIDPDDATHKTWFAAAVSGGIWKTTDAGLTWQNLTDDLGNISTNTMTMAPSDPSIIYAGTGEGYGGYGMVTGNGIYKTVNKGQTWDTLNSTTSGENFRFVNKIVVDKNDPDVVIAATNKGIFKSANGGLDWKTVYYKGNAVQDLAINPKNTTTIYAAINGLGVIKSYNNFDTWQDAYNGLGIGGRFSITVSNIDSNYVFVSVEAPNQVTEVYISIDGAASWRKLKDSDGTFTNFLGDQGWFNNVIRAHPFNKNIVFIGGVNVGKVEFKSTTSLSLNQVQRVDTFGTATFLNFVDFGGNYLGGGMSTGTEEGAEVEDEDYLNVEIRFGGGIKQKAYRFTVPDRQGAGVPPEDYTYRDYIDVHFQAWDIVNNRQLMVSFRDQDNDGIFNLVEREIDDNINGREYIFVHSLEYNTTPDINIAKAGGHYYKMIYFFWPTVPTDSTWSVSTQPVSKIVVDYGAFTLQDATTTVLADNTRNTDLHVDHHDMDFIITDAVNKKFTIVDANDGGLGLSTDGGQSWVQIKNGYITTQFYGVAKKPGAQEYIGGTQDNGTWQSPIGQTATASSKFDFRVAGDGFEALWHPDYPQRILASSYENRISLSMDGGETWSVATNGIHGDGPFITRLSNSPKNPNLVFAVGDDGVYRHTNFGVGRFGWELIEFGEGWTINEMVTSSHNVEVSLADPKIVWAGAGMFDKPDLHIFLSTDYGETFDTVPNFKGHEMGYLTSIATHPIDSNTAYLLFSISKRPKILRTTDFGQTWQDITKFNNDTSKNWFPDVIVYSLLVMPNDPDIIWVGTEIGIFESTDNGENWHYADNGLPAVSVWQLFIQDNTIVAATHGRGIWSASLFPDAIDITKLPRELSIKIYPNPSAGILNFTFYSQVMGEITTNIYNQSGIKVYSEHDYKREGNYLKQLDLQNLSSGNYIISVEFYRNIYSSKFLIR